MADIKIGGKTYSGITTLKIPLADGSGYALFAVDEETGAVTFDSYSVFVPQNVSDEWKVTGANGTLNMSTAEFLELFYDGFVSAPPSGMTVTKKSIGKDESGQYDMWEYDFCPTNYSRTILLSSGMHTYELSASFGLANFIGHLYTDTGNNAFDYIRENVRVKVIPVVNPWGFNQYPKTYGNVNGVNPNRNFDLNGEWAAYPTYTPEQNEWNVKGEYPFSEAEAHNLARWAEENWIAEFWIDCHTGEGYDDKDLWVYYSSDSVILDRINGGISTIETWFKETYGTECVTTRTIDKADSIRLHWAEEIAGIPGMTLEQAPKRTTFGTSASNEAADISNYSTNISTFVQEFLLEKYRSTESVAIQTVSASDISIVEGTASKTVTANISPADATQNKFEWVSSNENVVKVYGGTNKAIIVPLSVGESTITVKNRFNPAIMDTFVVTINEKEEEPESMTIGAKIGGFSSSSGLLADNTARIITQKLSVTPSTAFSVTSNDGYYVKAFCFDEAMAYMPDAIGGLNSATISGTIPESCHFVRILIKKANNSAFTAEEFASATLTINGAERSFVETVCTGIAVENMIITDANGTVANVTVTPENAVDDIVLSCDKLTFNGLRAIPVVNGIYAPDGVREITASCGGVTAKAIATVSTGLCTVLPLEIGSIDAETGLDKESAIRMRTAFIPVDSSTAIDVQLSETTYNVRWNTYNESKEFIDAPDVTQATSDSNRNGNWGADKDGMFNIWSSALVDKENVKYIRFLMRNADDSEITGNPSIGMAIQGTHYWFSVEN